MENMFGLLGAVLGLVVLQHVILFLLFFKCMKIFKLTDKLHQEFLEQTKAEAADMSEVLTKMMIYLEKEFSNNFENQKKMQEWFEKNMEGVVSNSTKTINSIEQTQRFLGRMSEALGITQRNNLQDIQ